MKSDLTLRAGKAPSEIRLFKPGKNPTQISSKPFVYNPANARKLRKQQAQREGRSRLHFDLDHHSHTGNPDPLAHTAYGSFMVEFRDTGIWASNIQWTPQGRELVESKKIMYFSPTFEVDKDNNVTVIRSCALTNNPAKLLIKPLVLSTGKKNMEDNKDNKVAEPAKETAEDKKAEAPGDGEPSVATEQEKDQLIESLKAELDAANAYILELEERVDALADEGSDEEEVAPEKAKERSPAEIVGSLVEDGYVLASAAPRLLKLSLETLIVTDKDRRSRPPVLKATVLESTGYKRTASADNAPQPDVTQNRVFQAFSNGQSIKA